MCRSLADFSIEHGAPEARVQAKAGLWPGLHGYADLITSRSSLGQRYGDEARGGIRRFHPHQNVVLAVLLGRGQCGSYIADAGDRLATDIENDVAFLEAVL